MIHSSWKRSGNEVTYKVSIPANSSASLKLTGKRIAIDGKVVYTKSNAGKSDYTTHLPAGSYTFIIEN